MRLSGIEIDDKCAVLRIPEPVNVIPPGTFDSNGHIRHLELPDTLRSIGTNAFRRNRYLMSAEIPEGVTEIGSFAFANCPVLQRVILPSTLMKAGSGMFYGCRSLNSIAIRPGGRFSIENGMLYDNTDDTVVSAPAGLRRPVLPENTREITDYAFNEGLVEITMSRPPQTIGPHSIPVGTLQGFLVGDTTEPTSMLTDPSGRILLRCCTRLGDVTVPEGIEWIRGGAFAGCDQISSITLPSSLNLAYGDMFRDLRGLMKVRISPGMAASLGCRMTDGKKTIDAGSVAGLFVRQNGMSSVWTPEKDGFTLWDPSKGEPPTTDVPRKGADGKTPETVKSRNDRHMFEPVRIEGTTFDSIAGQETAKKAIRERMVLPALHPEIFERYRMEPATGILLYGPPGTGKTMLARAVASEIGADFFSICPSDILDKYVGVSESLVKDLFEAAAESERAVIFFDDFDAIGAKRGNDRTPWQTDLINEILTQIQGIHGRAPNIHLMAATNRPWAIDSALIRSGRFSVHIRVDLPNEDAREQILRWELKDVPLGDVDLRLIASMTEGYNGADMKEIADNAKMIRITAVAEGGPDGITTADLRDALSRVPSTVCRDDVRAIEEYERSGSAPASEDVYVKTDYGEGDPSYG